MSEVQAPLYIPDNPGVTPERPSGQQGAAGFPANDENDSLRSDSPMSFASSSEDLKPEVRMTPYFRELTSLFPRRNAETVARVPCKARGLSENHDVKNAFIEIPPDALHGMLLVCSHPLCAKSGRRFRYCSVCEGPVSKRNFNKRHSHGRLAQTSSESFDYVYAPKEVVEANGGAPPLGSKRLRLDSRGQAVRVSLNNEARATDSAKPAAAIRESQSLPELAAAARKEGDVPPVNGSLLTGEEYRWLQLFRSRPTSRVNRDEVKQWIDSVVNMANDCIGSGYTANLSPLGPLHQRFPSAFDALESLSPEELSSLLDLQDLQLGDLTTL